MKKLKLSKVLSLGHFITSDAVIQLVPKLGSFFRCHGSSQTSLFIASKTDLNVSPLFTAIADCCRRLYFIRSAQLSFMPISDFHNVCDVGVNLKAPPSVHVRIDYIGKPRGQQLNVIFSHFFEVQSQLLNKTEILFNKYHCAKSRGKGG